MADRDRAGQGVADARGAARSLQAVPQDDARRSWQALTPSFDWNAYLDAERTRLPLACVNVTEPAVLQGGGAAAQARVPWPTGRPTCAGTPCTRGALSLRRFRAGELRFLSARHLRGVQERRRAGSAACAAWTATWARRWARTSSSQDLRPGDVKEQRARHDAARSKRRWSRSSPARLDGRRHQASRRSKSCTPWSTRSAIRTSGATISPSRIERGDFSATSSAATSSSRSAQLAKIGKPRGPRRVGHDAADGQRLLQPADERHQLPRRRAAAAALRSEDGRRAELRQHRRAPSATS